MAAKNSGMKLPTRPAPSLPSNYMNVVPQPSVDNSISDPFSPFNKGPSQQDKKKPPPRPPPPRLFTSQVSSQRRNIFGSSKKKQQKPAATAIVKPLPPASNIPVGTLIDLQSAPSSPQFPTKLMNSLSVGNISNYTTNNSLIESGFEDDFNSILSSNATTPAFDPWSTNSDFTPSSSKTPSPDIMMMPQVPVKNEVKTKSFKQNKQYSQWKPTIICVPSTNKVKPNRPPPPNTAVCNKNLDDDNLFLTKEGSPPMPCIPPPPPPPEVLNVLASGPQVPPRPLDNVKINSSEKQPYCIAQYDYESTHPDDLNFKVGDMISLVNDVNEEWFRGKHSNKEGIFPKSYVKVLIPLTDANSSPSTSVAIAIYPYTAESWDDLDLKEGDKIKILSRINNDWLYGECEGKRGQFPECFVQDISDLDVE